MDSLPEECISEILNRTSPRNICRLSSVSGDLKSVADSDAVRDKFLPSGHADILLRAKLSVHYPTKKKLFFGLTRQPIILDGGNISLALDRESGKKCYMLGARELAIAWEASPQYWQWTHDHDSRFHEVAVLLMVWWFDIRCKIETRTLSPNTVYVAFLVFKLARRNDGFFSLPISVSLKYINEMGDENGGEMMSTTVYVELDPSEPIPENCKTPLMINNGWFEVELEEFFVDPDDNRQVEIRLLEVKNSKSGLVVEGIELRPKVMV